MWVGFNLSPTGIAVALEISSTILTSSPHKRAVLAISKKSKPQQPRKSKQTKKSKQPQKKSSSKSSASELTDFCLVCGESNDEDWIQCKRCRDWVHEDCADISNPRFYFCDNCLWLLLSEFRNYFNEGMKESVTACRLQMWTNQVDF